MIYKSYQSNTTRKQIFLLSIPVFFSNLAIPFVGIVDTGLMGNLGETRFLAATSVATSIMTMIIWSFGFLRMGTVGIVSQLFARSDYREISRTLLRNFLIAIFISIIIILFKPLIIQLSKEYFTTSFETEELIETYISVRVISVPAELTVYILIGFFLGMQKTNISSAFVIILSVLNIIFSTLFVLSFELNIFGVALGTLIASYVTAILFALFTYNYISQKFKIVPSFQRLIIPSKIYNLIAINFDIFIRTLFLTFSFFWITYLGSKLGEDYLAINTILIQFIFISAFFLDAYAFTTEGIIGYTIGKRNKKSFLLVVRNSLQLSFFTALAISAFYIFFYKEIINIITDVEILRFMSYKHSIWIMLIPPVAAFCYQLDGIFIGASQTKELRNGMMISVASFIIISIYLTKYLGNHGLWFSLFLFMIFRSLTLKLFINNILKKF
tara:strand:+ start:560 stop:1885 length:1326 start_codon:yes stop_codon:yes gene_type:complete